MKRPGIAFALALASLILSPILIFIEMVAVLGAAMITYEPANPFVVKALSVAVVVLIALVALALPVLAIISGRRARAASRLTGTGGSGLATAAVVVGVVVVGFVLAAQVYIFIGPSFS